MNLSDELKHSRKIARRYPTSLMSNGKWRSLFTAIADAALDAGPMTVKFTDGGDVKAIRHLSLKSPYGFADSVEFGPFPLVAIEWLEFREPNAVRAVLKESGKLFPLEETPTGLRVVGHRI